MYMAALPVMFTMITPTRELLVTSSGVTEVVTEVWLVVRLFAPTDGGVGMDMFVRKPDYRLTSSQTKVD